MSACELFTGPAAKDTTAPAVTITDPASNVVMGATSVTLVGTATDSVGIVRMTTNSAGGAETDIPLNASGSRTVSFTATAELTEGQNTVTVNAYDEAGNKGTAPVLRVSSPASGSTVAAAEVAVEGEATDANGVVRMTYQVNGATEQTVSITAGTATTFSFTATGLAEGANTITLSALDAVGNRGQTQITVTRQNAPPGVLLVTVRDAVTGIAVEGVNIGVTTAAGAAVNPNLAY
jgi:hypothetical protein